MTQATLRIVILLVRLAAFFWLGSTPAICETIRVRAGEHDGFTRIAIDLVRPAEWQLGRNRRGYELRFSRPDITFDLDQVFRAIPQTRVAEIRALPRKRALAFTVDCACYARAFATDANTIVVDFRNGTAPGDSPFEEVLSAPAIASASPAMPKLPERWAGSASASGMKAHTDPRLALYWQGGRAGESPDLVPQAPGSNLKRSGGAPIAPLPLPLAPLPDPIASIPSPTLPKLPDRRIVEAEARLFVQLSRAASQGLVNANVIDLRSPTTSQEMVPSKPMIAAPPAEAEAAALTHVETSIDRDTLGSLQRPALTADGEACLRNADLAIGRWGDDRPAARQIADLRVALVGEFDRPDPGTVLALARLYLFLGFGAESRSVLRTFPIIDDSVPLMVDVATILDGGIPQPPNPLAGMVDCDTAAALWAVLALPDVSHGIAINAAALIRTFSALPPHLRKSLGPALSARLISIGATDAARAVRSAIARAPGTADSALKMMDARIKLAKGNALEGEAMLDQIVGSNDPAAAEALILTIQSRLDRGEAVNTRLTESAAALAYELRNDKPGPALAQASILARASSGDYSTAFEDLRRWTQERPDPLQAATARLLWSGLAEHADDQIFLDETFSEQNIFAAIEPEAALQIVVARRLITLGFTGKARDFLNADADAVETDTARVLLARAHLSEFDPSAALEQLGRRDDPESMAIRAQALAMLGRHQASATVFAETGNSAAAGAEAWRAGNLDLATEMAPGPIRDALGDLGVLVASALTANGDSPAGQMNPVTDVNSGPVGELAKARLLVETSQKSRAALTALFAATDDAAPTE